MMSRTVMKYVSTWYTVIPYSKTSSTIILYATFFIPISLANMSHIIHVFVVIVKNVGSASRGPISITFICHFPSAVKNTNPSCASSSANNFQYLLYKSPTINYFASVSISCTKSSQQGMGKASGWVTWFSFFWTHTASTGTCVIATFPGVVLQLELPLPPMVHFLLPPYHFHPAVPPDFA